MKLIPLYTSIADAADWIVTEDGFVSKRIMNKEPEPVMVKGQRLALPTDAQMKSSSKDIAIFHPLREDVLNPDTDVLDVLRKSLNARLNITTCWLVSHLLALAKSPDDQARMNPDQSAFLSQVKNVTDSTFEDWKKILGAMKVDAKTKTTVSIFTKKGGMHEGKKHNCVGVVKFALYDELKETVDKDGKPEVFGVKLSSKKNRDAILAVFRYLFQNIDTPGYYNYGSSSQVAAFMDALMQSFGRLASDINTVVDLFGDPEQDLLDGQGKQMRINGEWMQTFLDLGAIRNEIRMIPHQKGVVEDVKEAVAVPAKPGMAAAPYVGVAEPKKLHTDKGLDFAALLENNAAQQRANASFSFNNTGFGFQRPQQQQQQPNNPILSALAPQQAAGGFGFGQQQRPAHPFAEFQTGNRSGGTSGGGFGSTGGGGGFGFGRNRNSF